MRWAGPCRVPGAWCCPASVCFDVVGLGVVGDRGRTCAPRTAMSSRSLKSVPSGLEENAVADRKVRSRCRWARSMSQGAASGTATSWHQHSGWTLAPQSATLKPGYRREAGDHLQGEHRQQPVRLGAHVAERGPRRPEEPPPQRLELVLAELLEEGVLLGVVLGPAVELRDDMVIGASPGPGSGPWTAPEPGTGQWPEAAPPRASSTAAHSPRARPPKGWRRPVPHAPALSLAAPDDVP